MPKLTQKKELLWCNISGHTVLQMFLPGAQICIHNFN